MGKFKANLKLFRNPLLSVLGGAASIIFMFAVAPTPWLLIGIFGIVGSVVSFVIGITTSLGEIHLLNVKYGKNSSTSYKKELRSLQRKRREAVRQLFTMQNYATSSRMHYEEVLDLEKKIERHMGLDDSQPSSRY